MASPRELMVYDTLITNFFGRDRSRRFFGLNARGMAFTDRKGKIKGHCGNVAQNLAQQRNAEIHRSSPTHHGYCHSEATIFRLKVSSWSPYHTHTSSAGAAASPTGQLHRSPHPGPRPVVLLFEIVYPSDKVN